MMGKEREQEQERLVERKRQRNGNITISKKTLQRASSAFYSDNFNAEDSLLGEGGNVTTNSGVNDTPLSGYSNVSFSSNGNHMQKNGSNCRKCF